MINEDFILNTSIHSPFELHTFSDTVQLQLFYLTTSHGSLFYDQHLHV